MPLKKASINPFKNLQKPFQVLEAGLNIFKFRTLNYIINILIFNDLSVLKINANIIEYKEKKKKFQ